MQRYDPPFYIINHQVKVRITHRLVKSCTDYFPLLVTSEVKFRNAAILKTLSQLTYTVLHIPKETFNFLQKYLEIIDFLLILIKQNIEELAPSICGTASVVH